MPSSFRRCFPNPMKTIFQPSMSLVVGLLLPPVVGAQEPPGGNLVPNGSFEQAAKGPITFDQIAFADGWGNATLAQPELFDRQAAVKTVGIPENTYGTMEPQDGERYVGFMAWKDDQRRDYEGGTRDPFKPGWNAYSEYPEVELLQTLEEGATYEISFHVALAQNSDRAVAGIGALVSPLKLAYPNRGFLKERPQVVTEEILAERGKWLEIKGTFTADGDERFLAIGLFPTAIFETRRIIEGADNQYAYYYLDNIVLRKIDPVGP